MIPQTYMRFWGVQPRKAMPKRLTSRPRHSASSRRLNKIQNRSSRIEGGGFCNSLWNWLLAVFKSSLCSLFCTHYLRLGSCMPASDLCPLWVFSVVSTVCLFTCVLCGRVELCALWNICWRFCMLILAQTELHAFQITILLCLVLDCMACVIDRELPTNPSLWITSCLQWCSWVVPESSLLLHILALNHQVMYWH